MKPLIIGLGHELRGDDGIGPAILNDLQKNFAGQVQFVLSAGDTVDLLTLWQNRPQVIIIDACNNDNAAPGSIYRFNALARLLPIEYPLISSHAFNINTTVALGKLVRALPLSLTVYSIVGENFSLGTPMSKAVKAAIPVATRYIFDELVEGETPCMSKAY